MSTTTTLYNLIGRRRFDIDSDVCTATMMNLSRYKCQEMPQGMNRLFCHVQNRDSMDSAGSDSNSSRYGFILFICCIILPCCIFNSRLSAIPPTASAAPAPTTTSPPSSPIRSIMCCTPTNLLGALNTYERHVICNQLEHLLADINDQAPPQLASISPHLSFSHYTNTGNSELRLLRAMTIGGIMLNEHDVAASLKDPGEEKQEEKEKQKPKEAASKAKQQYNAAILGTLESQSLRLIPRLTMSYFQKLEENCDRRE